MDAQPVGNPAPLFGINIDPGVGNLDLSVRLAALADEIGLDLAGIQDHPYVAHFLDTWTLMTHLAARTRRVRFIPNVLNLALRPPAVLAKAAATFDILTPGRLELGIGSGSYWDGIAAYGGPRRSPAEAVASVDEAIDIFHALWQGGDAHGVRFQGRVYQLEGARPGPAPTSPLNVWVGALRPRMLNLIGRRADGWLASNTYALPEVIPGMQAAIDAGASGTGRSPAAIRRGYNLMGAIELPGGPTYTANREGALIAPVDGWIEKLAGYYTTLHLDTFIFWPIAGDPEEQAHVFAEQVVPGVRAAIGQG